MKQILNHLFEHKFLSSDEAAEIMLNIGSGKYHENQIAAFMSVFLMRSITVDELAGFQKALLDMCHRVDLSDYDPIDIVGTGGDAKNTFNISTLSCIVLAGAGYKVAKHGNYGATSVSGSSNVLEQHGVKFTTEVVKLKRSIEETNLAYLHAPLFNAALKTVAPIRKALGVRTFFNLMGPLVSPVKPRRQCLGVYNLKMARLYEYTYQQTGVDFAIIHSLDGYDELSLTGDMKIVRNSGEEVLKPTDLGFETVKPEELFGGETVAEASKLFDSVLNNTCTEAQKNVVLANSAVAIQVIEPKLSFADAVAIARESLESGNAAKAFKNFIQLNA
ncbi:MAG TPA: anthranilate phosphoribosyltransferase [Bacteroidales bacterium]|nr:anthranilate phosphoribosyltransferase [Bacteroidales bacterium]